MENMESKSKKNISIFMIVGGVIVLAKYLMNLNNSIDKTNSYIIMACAMVFVLIGVFSLVRSTNNNKI